MTNTKVSCSLVLLLCSLLGSCEGPDQIKVMPTAISYIVVYNRGNYSNYNRRRISNRDSINQICDLLNRAKQVSLDTVNVKVSQQFAQFDLYDGKNDRIAQLTYDITPTDGNIVWYRGGYFRSDSLDLLLK